MQNELLTVGQLAQLLNVHKSYVYRLNYENRGPAPIRLGNRTVRYRLEDVHAWLEQKSKNDNKEMDFNEIS